MMQTTSKWQATAGHVRYHTALRELGCVITGEKMDTQLQHVGGASCRFNKVWIGQWWVLILRRDFHDNREGQIYNVTDNKNGFEIMYGSQKEIFTRQLEMLLGAMAMGRIMLDVSDLPPPEVITAIASYVK